jgi:proprotein convertase subtilisin/kexin type 5
VTRTSCDSCHSNPGRIQLGNICTCTSTYADVTFNGVCTPCHYSCLTCSDGTANGCLSCLSGRTLTSNQCLCPTGFYDPGNNVVCQPCHSNCLTCSSGVITGCRSCQSLYYRRLSPSPTGSCICQDGYFEVGVLTCSQCSQYCLTCSVNLNNCTSCDSVTQHRVSASNNICTCMSGYY